MLQQRMWLSMMGERECENEGRTVLRLCDCLNFPLAYTLETDMSGGGCTGTMSVCPYVRGRARAWVILQALMKYFLLIATFETMSNYKMKYSFSRPYEQLNYDFSCNILYAFPPIAWVLVTRFIVWIIIIILHTLFWGRYEQRVWCARGTYMYVKLQYRQIKSFYSCGRTGARGREKGEEKGWWKREGSNVT